jgi:ORF6N domain
LEVIDVGADAEGATIYISYPEHARSTALCHARHRYCAGAAGSLKGDKAMVAKALDLVPVEDIAHAILILRGQKVLLDSELAALYGVPTKALNQAVKRNSDRFPEDFLFRLTGPETDAVNRSQIVTGSQKHRDPRFPPFAFTEHGAIMAATILTVHARSR